MAGTTTIRLRESTVDQLRQLAKENFRSVGQTVEWLIHEYKIRNESAQEYCEREPMRSELLQAMKDIKTGKGYKGYNSVEELFDDIP